MKNLLKDIAERAVKTFAQSLVAGGSTGASYAAGQVIRGDFNWAF